MESARKGTGEGERIFQTRDLTRNSQSHASGSAITPRVFEFECEHCVMCIVKRSNHATLAYVVLFLAGIILSFGLCQNAEPHRRNIVKGVPDLFRLESYTPGIHQQFSRDYTSAERKDILEQNGRLLLSDSIVKEPMAETENHVGKHKSKFLLSENAVRTPHRRNVNVTILSKQREGNVENRVRKKRRRFKNERRSFNIEEQGITESIRENVTRDKEDQTLGRKSNVSLKTRLRNHEVRRSRVERRRRRKKEKGMKQGRKRNRNSSRSDGKQQDVSAYRSSKFKSKINRSSNRFPFDADRPSGNANMSDYSIDRSSNINLDHNSSMETIISTTISSSLQRQSPILEVTRVSTARTTPRHKIYNGNTVEREIAKQLQMEISKLDSSSILHHSIFGDATKRLSGEIISSGITVDTIKKKSADDNIVSPANDKVNFGNSRYDAVKMLGYSRTAEDLPILDLENEMLARTFKDYNTFMTSSTKFRTSPLRYDEIRGDTSHRVPSSHPPRIPIINSVESDEVSDNEMGENTRATTTTTTTTTTMTTIIVTKISQNDNTSIGDLSCINGTFLPAPLSHYALIKYVKSSVPGHEYLEADYECMPGFYMVSSTSRLICRNRQWIGQMPNCKIKQTLNELCAQTFCEHVCTEINGRPVCSCYKGFRSDGHKCIDINECETGNTGCEYKCMNTWGSFRCQCPNGMKQGSDQFTCLDINECLLNDGHGPCQDTCRNLIGGYECSCEGLEGTSLTADNHTCERTQPCSINNAGCSHTCLSTMGRVFCLCPDGFILEDDWKTCQDVDECSVPDLQTELCRYGCINTPGSYRCAESTEMKEQPVLDRLSITCLPGYEQTPHGTCIDINECMIDNGGCMEICENTDGSFFCACNGDEKALSSDGKTCVDINSIACLPLNPVAHGYLICSRSPISKLWRDRRKVTNRPGTKCSLNCARGYQLHGEYELICRSDGTWDGMKHGKCIEYSKPRLECPNDVIAELPPGGEEAFVTFDQPATDLDWFRCIRSKPSWGTRLEANLRIGIHEVTFFAKHPMSKKQASCVFRIIVKGGEAPKVKYCPNDIELIGENGTTVAWIEPVFTDNVGITQIINNESSGRHFEFGEHRIEYEANDEAGWSSKCVFNVILRQE